MSDLELIYHEPVFVEEIDEGDASGGGVQRVMGCCRAEKDNKGTTIAAKFEAINCIHEHFGGLPMSLVDLFIGSVNQGMKRAHVENDTQRT